MPRSNKQLLHSAVQPMWRCCDKCGVWQRIIGPDNALCDGSSRWYDSNGLPNRDDGPAMIHPGVCEVWLRDGVLHRVDGPAFVRASGHLQWWVEGNNITQEVRQMIRDKELRPFKRWTDADRMIFRLRFGDGH